MESEAAEEKGTYREVDDSFAAWDKESRKLFWG